MSARSKAAAVLSVLAVGVSGVAYVASQMPEVYGRAGASVDAGVPAVAAESQEEVIEAAAILRQMGHTATEAADSIATHTRAPQAAVRALVGDRRAAVARDPRQRNGRVGVLAASADVVAVEAAIRDTMCESLVDPRGVESHPLLADCLAFWSGALGTRYCVDGVDGGRGAMWSALPSQRRDLASTVQPAGGVYVADPDDVSGAYAAEVSNQGWGPCPEVAP